MFNIDISEVTSVFAGLTHLTGSEASNYAPVIKSAKAYFERLFLRDIADSAEKELAEYACACKAFLEYTVLMAATPKTYSTQSGGIFAKVAENKSVVSAECLYRNACAALPRGLIRDDGFIFEGTEG